MTDDMIGRTVSHYRILAVLGQGGMGTVYRAEDLDLSRPVAIKFLPISTKPRVRARERFVQEARAASALDHPHIGVVHEITISDDGRDCIVMACYEGGTLQQRIAEGRLTPAAAVEIALQIASGLGAAHKSGIIHRDLKPANILFDTEDRAKIVDFGLAKQIDATRLTQSGQALGTAAYMSPEQALGREVDQRSDIFALGILLYEMVTGQLPFKGDNPSSLLYQIVHGQAEPLPAFDSPLRKQLEPVLQKALAKDPLRRYQRMEELYEDLMACRDLCLVPDPTVSHAVPGRPRPFRRIRPWWILGLAGVAVVLVLGTWLLSRTGRSTGPLAGRSLAVMEFEDLVSRDEGSLSSSLTGLLNVGLIESSPIRIMSTEYLLDLRQRLFGVERGPIETGQALAVARKAGATLLLTGQIGHLEQRQYVAWRLVDLESGVNVTAERLEGDDLLALADGIIAGVLPAVSERFGIPLSSAQTPVGQLTTTSEEAYWHYLQGTQALAGFRRDEAERELNLAASLDTSFALPHLALSQFYFYPSRAKARSHWSRAWELRENLGVQDRLRLDVLRERLEDQPNYQVVLRLYEDMASRWPDNRQILSDLSEVLAVQLNNYAQAVEVARQGLELYPDDLNLGMRLASGLRCTGRHEEALAAAHRFTQQQPFEPNTWDELGTAFLAVAQADSAEWAFQRALTVDPTFWFSRMNLAATAYCRGDGVGAATRMEALIDSLALPPSSRVITYYSNVLGLIYYYRELGHGQRARAAFESALRHQPDHKIEHRYNRLLLTLGEAELVLQRCARLQVEYPEHYASFFAVQAGLAHIALAEVAEAKTALATATDDYEHRGTGRYLRDRLAVEIALAENEVPRALRIVEDLWAYGVHFPGPNDIELRDLHARVLHQAGQPEAAVAVLEECLRLYGAHHEARYTLGVILEGLGRPTEAREQYERFLAGWAEADQEWPQWADAERRLRALR